ncbi:MAG: MAPEG family protein [Pseudomonadales bacterium]|nr:MAPEG family protein [Pseudomonadales bacterium]
MITWILAVFGLYFFNLMLVSYLRFTETGISKDDAVRIGLGPRDDAPSLGVMGARADRALTNLKESLPFFITFALLNLIKGGAADQAMTGAVVFTVARYAYLPSYMWGVPGLRSLVWMVAVVGLVMMLLPLV